MGLYHSNIQFIKESCCNLLRSFICIRQGYLLLQSCEGHSPTISGELVDVADLKNIDFKHNLPRTGMLYFFCYESHFKEEGDFQGAGEYIGINRHDMVLLFQVDSDYNNCNMMWGDLRMFYF